MTKRLGDSLEYFRDVPGYEGVYQVSNRGRLLSLRNEKVLSLSRSVCGYRKVKLQVNCKHRSFTVHHLVLWAFRGPRPNGMTVNHKNFIRDDNNLANLEFLTHKDNIRHSSEVGRYCKRKRSRRNRFTDEQIRFMRTSPLSAGAVGKMLGTTQSYVGKIRRRVNYAWLV